MTRNDQLRTSILTNLDRRLDARGKAAFESLSRLTRAEFAARRSRQRKRLAAGLCAILGGLAIVIALGAFCYTIHNPAFVFIFLAIIALGLWGRIFLSSDK